MGSGDCFNAFVAWTPDAPSGTGPLADLRAAIKDNISVAGLPFTAGHPLFEGRIAAEDAPAVRRVRDAGARIIGVTRTDAGGFGVTTPEVDNPAAPGRSVGGSSGGSAAAVAAGYADIALGTDTGGSVRIPAACTGLIGFKPTRGRIPIDGLWPLSPSLDHVGVIGRDLETVARTARTLLDPGPDASQSNRPLQVGIDAAPLHHCDDATAAGFAAVIAALRAAGIAVIPLPLPARDRVLDIHGTILLAEARHVYRGLTPAEFDRLAPTARRGLAYADTITPAHLAAARHAGERQTAAIQALFDRADLIMTPTICCAVPLREARRVDIRGHSVPIVQAMIGETALFNLTGHPSLTLPTAVDIHGLPFSVQIAARRGADMALFDAARHLPGLLRNAASPAA